MKLTEQQARTYFETRLGGQKFMASRGDNYATRCPFHDDRNPSLSVNFAKGGVWKCHAGCGEGGVVEFEKRFSGVDDAGAAANVAEICGLGRRLFGMKPEAVYRYRDEDGKVLFEKLKFRQKNGEKFFQYRTPDGQVGASGIRKPLYNLPELLTASDVAVAEGEKDCDRLVKLDWPTTGPVRFAATTNHDGAAHWKPEYSLYFYGKRVVIFADNDEQGRAHAQQVAASVHPFARNVRVCEFPELAEHGDVSDWLEKHSADDLRKRVLATPVWQPPAQQLVVPAPLFLTAVPPDIDWLLNGVIQRGANGFIGSLPKVGKSWLAVDLALSLALGKPWLGFEVPRAARVALITREDAPALTKWRMKHLLDGKGSTLADLEDRLYVNSREQSDEFRIDDPKFFEPMLAELKTLRPELVILDVFRRMHSVDENDNTEMQGVLDQLARLQREAGCAVCVVHHFNKYGEGTLIERLRGATAICGFAEWVIAPSRIPGQPVELSVRKMEFELKAACPPESFYYEVRSSEFDNTTRVQRSDWTEPPQSNRARDGREFVQ